MGGKGREGEGEELRRGCWGMDTPEEAKLLGMDRR